jgi:hypothetical protein
MSEIHRQSWLTTRKRRFSSLHTHGAQRSEHAISAQACVCAPFKDAERAVDDIVQAQHFLRTQRHGARVDNLSTAVLISSAPECLYLAEDGYAGHDQREAEEHCAVGNHLPRRCRRHLQRVRAHTAHQNAVGNPPCHQPALGTSRMRGTSGSCWPYMATRCGTPGRWRGPASSAARAEHHVRAKALPHRGTFSFL